MAVIEIPGMWDRGEIEEVVKAMGSIVVEESNAEVR